jgi:hypothetical protein
MVLGCGAISMDQETVHRDAVSERVQADVFVALWAQGLVEYDTLQGA